MAESMKHITDEELYTLLRGKNKTVRLAFEELYSRYSTKIFTYCRKVLGDDQLAEDIFQETFMKLFESVEHDREMENFNGFLIKICRNLCLNEKTRKKYEHVFLDEMKLPDSLINQENVELKHLLEKAIDSLPDEFREPIILKEYFGMTYKEIAEITNTNLALVRTRIWRAKSKLRELMSPYKEDYQNY